MPVVGHDLVAIDVHTHPQTEEFIAAMGARHTQMGAHFGTERPPVSFAEQADAVSRPQDDGRHRELRRRDHESASRARRTT